MNPELFRDSPAGKLINISIEGVNHVAFVPNPLPPKLTFDTKLVKLLSKASHALGSLASLGDIIPNSQLLISPFIRREAVLSSRIEGTEASLADIFAYEAGQLALPGIGSGKRAPESDIREVFNYVRSLEYGIDRIKNFPLSLRLFRELHEHLMKGVRGGETMPGQFRNNQNWIGAKGCKITDSRYVPPPIPEMHQALDAFEKHLHTDDLPPLIHLALAHYQFEAIHPFRDGNGRVGRLLLSLMLAQKELLPLPILYLSAYFERHRDEYMELLFAVSQRGAWDEWVQFFLQGIAEQSEEAIVSTKKFLELQAQWRQRLIKARASALLIRLSDSLFQSPIITIPKAQKILNLKTYKSAKLNVYKLVKAGILEAVDDSNYDKAFIAREILQIVREKSTKP